MNLIMKDHADKTWLKPTGIAHLLGKALITINAMAPTEPTQKKHGFILMVCVLALFGLTAYASINTALSNPLVKVSHYALVDQNGEE